MSTVRYSTKSNTELLEMAPSMRFKYYKRIYLWVCPLSHHTEQIWGLREHVCVDCGVAYSENDIEIVFIDKIPVLGERKWNN